MSLIRFVYITIPNKAEARRLGRTLVDQRFAACVNIIDGMESIYRWKNKTETAEECVMIAKTRSSKVAALIKFIETHHSYETPCALSFKIEKGSKRYVKWLLET